MENCYDNTGEYKGHIVFGLRAAVLLAECRCPNPVPAGLIAVSYTHLDVYKRQVQRNALAADTVLVLRYHPLFKSGKGIPHHVHHGVAAVSYTHLDVYKRQGQERGCSS